MINYISTFEDAIYDAVHSGIIDDPADDEDDVPPSPLALEDKYSYECKYQTLQKNYLISKGFGISR